jgi:hypothetical protein
MRHVVLGALFLLLSFQPASVDGADNPIAVAEVSAAGAGDAKVDEQTLRALANRAVNALDKSKLPRRGGVLLSVSLVRLEARASGQAEVHCTVSAALRDRKRGAIFATVEGSATGRDDARKMPALERATLTAAVEGAIARVPEAMFAH